MEYVKFVKESVEKTKSIEEGYGEQEARLTVDLSRPADPTYVEGGKLLDSLESFTRLLRTLSDENRPVKVSYEGENAYIQEEGYSIVVPVALFKLFFK